MKKTFRFLSMAALALVGAVMTGCSNEDNIDNPQQPENKGNLVTLTATVGFDAGAGTRALDETGHKTFATGDKIAVIYKNKSGDTKKAVSDEISSGAGTASATFTVTLDNPDNTERIRYIYPAAMAKATVATDAYIDDDDDTVDFDKLNSQNGTLATLGSSLDLCTYDADDWTSGTLPTGDLENKLAILAITLKNSGGSSNITSSITDLTITTSDYGNSAPFSYSFSGSVAEGPIYMAIRPTSYATINISATDGTNNYIKTLTDKDYEKNTGYNVSWKMGTWDGDLSGLAQNVTVLNGMTITGTLGGNYRISIADGATVTLDGVTINGTNDLAYEWAGITCLGGATIILKDGTTNTVKGFYEDYPGIHVPSGSTLTIQGTGSLDASSNGAGAGIGGGWSISCGNIVIQGGTITATGDYKGAGIGGGGDGISCGNIEIQGGTITATGGYEGAGIGGGSGGICGNITINGGTVTATGGYDGAGIGSGYDGSCGDITIESGTVEATGGEDGSGIGCGDFGKCGAITITADVTSLTATKGSGRFASASIGKGEGNSCGTVTVCGTVYWDGSDYQNGGDTYLTTSPFNYPAPPSESFDTNVENQTTYDGTHFTITAGFADSWGIDIGHSRTLTITAKGSETIKKVEFHCTIGSGAVSSTSVTAGTLNWVCDTDNGSIDNVNTTTVSMSNSAIDWVQIDQITVYYE